MSSLGNILKQIAVYCDLSNVKFSVLGVVHYENEPTEYYFSLQSTTHPEEVRELIYTDMTPHFYNFILDDIIEFSAFIARRYRED